MANCFLSHLGPQGCAGCHQPEVVASGPSKALPVDTQTGLGAVLWANVHRTSCHDALPRAVWATSFGHLGLQGAGQIEVPPDGVVVGAGTKHHKEMPDGVGKGDPPITPEEHHAQAVEDPSGHQLPNALGVGLSARTRVGHRSGEQPAGPGAPHHTTRPPKTHTLQKRDAHGEPSQNPGKDVPTCAVNSPQINAQMLFNSIKISKNTL